MADSLIPFNRVSFEFNELQNIEQAIHNGHISGDGPFCKKTEDMLSHMHDGADVLLTPSCSHALELAARLIQFEPGDEVIVPSFTFVTTVSSFVANGATPVFCDIDPVTLGLDLEQARKLISPKTRAICLVHYGGVPAHPEGFAALAEEFGLVLIEDNAHGLGGVSGNKTLGTFGALSTLSFHETKNVTCGEGGALVINDPTFVERAEILREKGTDRSQFFRGQVDKYTWHDIGSSWVMSDILAGLLAGQLDNFATIQRRRKDITDTYRHELSDWATSQNIILGPAIENTSHLCYLLMNDERERSDFISHMKSHGVMVTFHYVSLHLSPAGKKYWNSSTPLPVSEDVSSRLIRLPVFPGITDAELDRVIHSAQSFVSQVG